MEKINSDFILLIFNCKKYSFKALKQRETWLKDFKLMPFFHVVGNINLETDYFFDYEYNILNVKVDDDYNSLPKKVMAAFNAINKEYVFKYIFKTDDDQNLISDSFFKTIQGILLNKIPKVHYAGYIVNVDKPYLSQYHRIHPELPENIPILKTTYCSGRFYLLSDLAIQQILGRSSEIEKEYLEDYSIGLNLDPVLKTNMLNINTNKYFVDFFP
uniref:Hexosyltransferase n=1 Tax=viral metagenome TaxID=1070528 RepID=A0A6C0KPG9_9ZZZZ